MHSKINPPARRSRVFNEAATLSMESLLRANQRIRTRDNRKRDMEIALRIECLMPRYQRELDVTDRDWNDGWAYGIALAARMMHEQTAMAGALAARGR